MSASNAALSKLSPEAFSDWCEDLFESQEIDPAWAAFGESKLKPLLLRDMPKGGRLIDFECRQNLCRVEAWVPEPKEVTGNILASDGPMMDRGGGTVLVIRRIDEDGGLRTIHLIGDGDVIISPM